MVKVLMLQMDGKMKNLALLKLLKHHKDKGDDVEFLDLSGFEADIVYGSKIFMGGSGYDIKSELPEDIEILTPDYEKFKMDYSIGFTTRGCIRDCGFCIVREKEGCFRDVNMDWIKHQKVIVMDNNFLASKKCKEKLQFFIDNELKINFNQGLDIRLINDELANLLSNVKYYDRKFKNKLIYFAFDDINDEDEIRKKLPILLNYISPNEIMVYIIVGYDSTFDDDMRRYKILWEEFGVYPYVQVYNNRTDISIINHFARWVNKRIHKVATWEEYYKHANITKIDDDDIW